MRWRSRGSTPTVNYVSSRGAHVDLGAEAQRGGAAGVVEVEDDPLALAQHAEARAVEGVGGEVVLGEVGVARSTTPSPVTGS